MIILMALPSKLSFINRDEYSLDLLNTVEGLVHDSNIVDSFIRLYASTSVKLGFNLGDTLNLSSSSLHGLICIDDQEINIDALATGLEESLSNIGEGENNILVIMPNFKDPDLQYYKNEKVETTMDLTETTRDLHSMYAGNSKLAVKDLNTIRTQLGLQDKGSFH